MLRVREIETGDFDSWDRFVERLPEESFHHQLRWRELMARMYGGTLTPVYLVAERGDSIEGVLPLFIFRHRLFGNKAISLPFSTHGGCRALSDEAERALVDEAVELTKGADLEYLELRNEREIPMGSLRTSGRYFTLRLELCSDYDVLLKGFRKTTQRYVRRSRENELDVKMFSDDIKGFNRIYSIGQRNLGTPSSGLKWLRLLFELFPDNHRIAEVSFRGKLIAAVLLRLYKSTVSYVIGASLPDYRRLYPNYRLFGAVLRHSCEQGYRYFDFGRSIESSGTFFFKTGWGAEPVQLHYQYYLHKNKAIPDTSQASRKRAMFAMLWKRLPLVVANAAGPAIRGYFP
jgi:FemAB-related protein (PEP-CTERM system-associated)